MKYCAAILALEHYLSIVASLLIPIPSVCTFFTGSVTYCRQHLRNDLKKMKQLQKKVFFVPFFLFKLSFFSNQIHSPAVLAQWWCAVHRWQWTLETNGSALNQSCSEQFVCWNHSLGEIRWLKSLDLGGWILFGLSVFCIQHGHNTFHTIAEMLCVVQNCHISSFSNHTDHIKATCDSLAKEKKKEHHKKKTKPPPPKKTKKPKPNSIDHSVIANFHSTLKTMDVDKNLRQFLLWDVQGWGCLLVGRDFMLKNREMNSHEYVSEKKQKSEGILNIKYESWYQINWLKGRK